jgi:hypothetical protein
MMLFGRFRCIQGTGQLVPQLTRVCKSTGRLLTLQIESNDDVDTHRSIPFFRLKSLQEFERGRKMNPLFLFSDRLCVRTSVATSGIQKKNSSDISSICFLITLLYTC